MDLWLKIERPRRGVKLSLGVEEISSAAYRQRPRTGREQADGLVHEIVGSLPIRAQCRQFNVGSRKLAILRAGNGPGAGLPIDWDGLVTPNLLQRRQVRPGLRKALQKFGQTVHLTATQRSARRQRNRLDLERQVVSCGSKTCQRGKGRRAAVRMLQDLSHVAASAVGPVEPRSPRNSSLIVMT